MNWHSITVSYVRGVATSRRYGEAELVPRAVHTSVTQAGEPRSPTGEEEHTESGPKL